MRLPNGNDFIMGFKRVINRYAFECSENFCGVVGIIVNNRCCAFSKNIKTFFNALKMCEILFYCCQSINTELIKRT